MGNLSVWVLALVKPILGRILTALGFSVISIAGMDLVLSQAKSMLLSNMQTLPAAALQFALLGGVGTAFGMLFGAATTRLLLWKLTQATKILGVTQ